MCGYCGVEGHGSYGGCCGMGLYCASGMSILAGILLLLMGFWIWTSWLNLYVFFGIMLLLIGIHGFLCKCCRGESCDYDEAQKPPKKKR